MGSKGRSGVIGFDYVCLTGQDRTGHNMPAGIILTVSQCGYLFVKLIRCEELLE